MQHQRRNWLMKMGMALAAIGLAKLKLFATPSEHKISLQKMNIMKQTDTMNDTMKLGAFSVSLNVKDLQASRQFYETLGFIVFAGADSNRYLIMKNGVTLIGLFQGMFEKTILTFNPGWDQDAKTLEQFDDVRSIQKHLKSKGIPLVTEADENSKGPASLIVLDPDGNQILFDQHI